MLNKIEKIRDQWLQRSYYLAKNSAKYRGEEFTLSWEHYRDLWCKDDRYLQKGRTVDSLCLARLNWDQGWTETNVAIRPRREVLMEQAQKRKESK